MKGWAQKTFASMTLEQKLGQLMVSFLDNEGDIRELARAGALGGLYSVAGRTVREAAEWVADIQQEAAIPLLLCSDFETGSTFAGGTPLPSPMAVGATGDAELARAAGSVTAREVGAIGFRFMGSPVVDINRPDNPIVSTRAFGEEPDAVSRMALAYAEGVQGEGVIACLKHFPGTGDIDTDTHMVLPTLPFDLERMNRVELVPYREGIRAGVRAIMTTHIIFSQLDAEHPATLSRAVLTGLLRERMGFQGIIISDAMAMHAIADNYDFDTAVALAVEAGCDAIIPNESMRTFEALKKGFTDGKISDARVDESVKRMLAAKEELGLPGSIADPDQAESTAGTPEHKELARRIAEASIARLADPDGLLPLRGEGSGSVGVVILSNYDEGTRPDGTSGPNEEWSHLERALRGRFSVRAVIRVTPSARPQIDPDDFDRLICGVFVRHLAGSEEGGVLPDRQKTILRELLARSRTAFILSFGSPYPVADLADRWGCLCAYSDCADSVEAAVRVLAGELPARGQPLPSLSGSGIDDQRS